MTKLPADVQDTLMHRRETWITGIKDAGREANKPRLKMLSIRLAELDEVIAMLKREGLWNGNT